MEGHVRNLRNSKLQGLGKGQPRAVLGTIKMLLPVKTQLLKPMF